MKKIFLIFTLMLTVSVLYAQKNRVNTMPVDTLQGNETVSFEVISFSSHYKSLTIQALCEELGGTSDGTLRLDASVDGTSYETITDAGGLAKGYPNDTLTIVDNAVWQFVIQDVPFKYYKVVGTGTAGDTTKVTLKYIYK